MIQFNVGGQYLELPADFDLQFQKKNILFAFDDIECERSISFDIPSTIHNDRIFGIAKDYHYTGNAMRQRFAAQMQAGAVVKDGYLYVEQYNYEDKVYNAIFVMGELIGIQELAQAGKIADYYRPTDTIVWTDGWDGSFNTILSRKGYVTEGGQHIHNRPSINLYLLTKAAASVLGYSLTVPSACETIYLTPGHWKNSQGEEAVYGNTLRLIDNLPDLTCTDLIKTLAFVSGSQIISNGKNIYLDDLTTGWSTKPLAEVIKRSTMVRTFGEFAQHNTINGIYNRYDQSVVSLADYTINNTNIEQENELFEMPFQASKGRDYREGHYWVILYVQEDTISRMQTGAFTAFLDSLAFETNPFPKNNVIQSLCNGSTTIELTARMTFIEYEMIKPKTKLWYDGAEWVWTEAQYEKGQVTLKLAKVQ